MKIFILIISLAFSLTANAAFYKFNRFTTNDDNLFINAATLTNILQGYVIPQQFGATGDGVTDDTAAMQQWIAVACWSNWIAFLPPAPGGFYKITDTLLITNGQNAIRIQGAGGSMHTSDSVKSKCCIAQFGVGKDGIVITNVQSSVNIDGILVTNGVTFNYATRGIAFDGNVGDSDISTLKNSGIEYFGKGLFLASMADMTVQNCSIGLNGEGVFVGAGTYTPAPVLNNNYFVGCQISYNRSNNFYCSAGTTVVVSSDIAQAAITAEQNLCHGAYVTNGYLTAIACNFENDIGSANAQPCIIATSSSGSGGVVLIGGSGGGGGGGANAYSLVVTNVPVQIRGWTPVGIGAADGAFIVENISIPNISLMRSDMPLPVKMILNSTVFGTEQVGPLFARNCFSTQGQIAKNDFLFQNHDIWIDSNGVSQGGFDDISSLYAGVRLNGYAGNNNLTQVELYKFAKQQLTQITGYNLYMSNAVLIASNTMANIGTRIGNMAKGDILIASSNGVPLLVASNPSGTLSTNVLNAIAANNNYTSYASGTAYTLTATPAQLAFGTTSPGITIANSGTYTIRANIGVKYNAATYAGAQTVTLKLRRTNNTAADLSNASRTIELPVLTTFTGGDVMTTPEVIYTATAGDIVQVWGSVSATPSAGSVLTDSAEIVAVRIF